LKNRENYEIIDPVEVGISESSIVLTARSGRAALKHRLDLLGIALEKDKLDEVYEEFLLLADRKKDIKEDDLLMLVGEKVKSNHRIKLDFLQVVTGKNLVPMATIRLDISGEKFTATESGNGPVDAAIKAVKCIIHRKVTLQEFLIQAINKGSDDIGKVHMQVEYDENIYNGFGANTDIITASVEAFIDAINKIGNAEIAAAK
jgi:2-isopropylmalate synthase